MFFDFGVEVVMIDDLCGGDGEVNVCVLCVVFDGEKNVYCDIVFVNVVVFFVVVGVVGDIKIGMMFVIELFESGVIVGVFDKLIVVFNIVE